MDTLQQLEQIIDRVGLKSTVEALAIVCDLKGDHLVQNWQDQTSASVWYRNMKRLDKVAAKLET